VLGSVQLATLALARFGPIRDSGSRLGLLANLATARFGATSLRGFTMCWGEILGITLGEVLGITQFLAHGGASACDIDSPLAVWVAAEQHTVWLLKTS